MCYAIPGLVKEINNKIVLVDYYGETKKAINEFPDLAVGDYIYAQGGYVISKIPKPEAESILDAWKDIFFDLQDVDVRLSSQPVAQDIGDFRLSNILDKASQEKPLAKEDLLYLLNLSEKSKQELLFKTANFLRHKYQSNSCCVHGIIEISNQCSQHCAYCGISLHNKDLVRYKMSYEEIIQSIDEAVNKYGFKALVLQSGENCGYAIDELAKIIKDIRDKYGVLIFISFGEIGLPGLEKLYHAGARGLLMRFETSNPALYTKLHPGQELKTRIEHLKYAYQLGYLIITGGLIGLPGQTDEDIINDLRLTKELNAEMYTFGPFIAHPNTPLAKEQTPEENKIIKTLALARLLDPQNAKILVTTGLETISSTARKEALLAGANSVMLNVTPLKYRKLYNIYPNRAHESEDISVQIDETLKLLKGLGRAPTDLSI